ncbi:MAG: DUF2628 domain-containing protein [Rhizobiales bacterium]|nr:DUF2628 domain-containing protein [Hyphomicrobiales bacterium]
MLFDPSGREIPRPIPLAWFILCIAGGVVVGGIFGWKIGRTITDVFAIASVSGLLLARIASITILSLLITGIQIQRRRDQWSEWETAHAKAYAPVAPPMKPIEKVSHPDTLERVEYFPDLAPAAPSVDRSAAATLETPASSFELPSAGVTDPPASSAADPKLMAAYVGPNASVMVAKMLRGAEGKFAWNWPIFFFAPIYLAYRKMYGPLALFLAFTLTTIFLEEWVGRNLAGLNVGAFAGLGFAFYRLYWKRYERAFEEASAAAQLDPQQIVKALKDAGGVSRLAAAITAVAIVLWMLTGVVGQ